MDGRSPSVQELATVSHTTYDTTTSPSANKLPNLSSDRPRQFRNHSPTGSSYPIESSRCHSKAEERTSLNTGSGQNGSEGRHLSTRQGGNSQASTKNHDLDNAISMAPAANVSTVMSGTKSLNKMALSGNPTTAQSINPVSNQVPAQFQGIALNIPSTGLSEDIGTDNMKFSNRGSMLINGKKIRTFTTHGVAAVPEIEEPDVPKSVVRTTRSVSEKITPRHMSTDEEVLSEKVRSFYVAGSDANSEVESQSQSTLAKRMNLRWQDAVPKDSDSTLTVSRATSTTDVERPTSIPSIKRETYELAGGLEDWQDIDNSEVDRYGFIIPKTPTRHFTPDGIQRSPTASGVGLQRVSSSLQLASDTPRRKHLLRRAPSKSNPPTPDRKLTRTFSNQSLSRPSSTRSASMHRNQPASRSFSNRFLQNKDQRLMDEAGDMLTLPRSATDSSNLNRSNRVDSSSSNAYTPTPTPQSRRKEAEREEKWRKMARPVTGSGHYTNAVGGGMTFTFDTSNAKLIERTWKGIPDTWRATAWHAFLSASVAKHNRKPRNKNKQLPSDEELTLLFGEYQTHSSPDDVQIDIDVPRTISSHIMFRRRYRGGQRLLFRVLHAMSMHFADTGYVQGMATLAASLLAYYDEEKAFIMLARLWELRGLEKLYRHGFGGLMEALDDFETKWLGQGEVKERLDKMGIGPTAYGTRWYLTLFNYSIPFAAQLRVWDVFMLLGDNEDDHEGNTTKVGDGTIPTDKPFGTTLDILHATSAALIDGMRDILMTSDFENAMKVLTSWVPIRDEDLFMRVARAEWKVHKAALHARA